MVKETPVKKDEKPETNLGGKERNSSWPKGGASNTTATKRNSVLEMMSLMEAVVERKNMTLALQRVEKNAGSAGGDKREMAEDQRGIANREIPAAASTSGGNTET